MRQETKRIHFSKKVVESTRPPEKGRTVLYDDETPELGLRVTPNGGRSWFWFRRVNGRAKFETIGHYPGCNVEQARSKARELSGALEKFRRNDFKGENPFNHGNANATSAEAVAEEWLTRDVKQTRTAYETERILRKEILPICKGKLITEITRVDVLRLLDAIVDRGAPVTANRTLSTMKRWMNWCIDRGYFQVSPIANLKDPSKEKSRDRVLDDEELRDVWNASGEIDYPYGPFVRLLILTAQRRGEADGMRCPDLELARDL
jgi:hypothetical protein